MLAFLWAAEADPINLGVCTTRAAMAWIFTAIAQVVTPEIVADICVQISLRW